MALLRKDLLQQVLGLLGRAGLVKKVDSLEAEEILRKEKKPPELVLQGSPNFHSC